ncbi:Nn.00g097130.m01.CDS01 [Neocucurbitaria sp. VM-36]
MKTICIIGAGPAGLVTAKTLLHKGSYSITVFETANRVGGMWRAQPGEIGDKCSPDMRTNLSRYTVAFSDLSWTSVNLSDPLTGPSSPDPPPTFPKAWQVGRYLETYAQRFGLNSNIMFNKRVTHANLLEDLKTWEVTSVDNVTMQETRHKYDYLIVASGFFGHPIASNDPSPDGTLANIQHSSHFRDLPSLTNQSGKIVVIGGGISGSEAAAQAAFQISNARASPGTTRPAHAKSTVYHVINRPFYCLPRYLPQDPHNAEIQDFNLAPKFLPLDLVLYDLSRRGQGEISAAITTVPPEKAKKGHEFVRSLIGGDQRGIGNGELVYKPDQMRYPGYTGITDTYTEFVRSGILVPVQGWVDEIRQRENSDLLDIVLKHYEPWANVSTIEPRNSSEICEVSGIIEATGYKTSLDFLDAQIQKSLHYDPCCPRIPYLLTRGSIFAREVPTLGFVGFYEGPYWSVMEMQARIIAEAWSKHESADGHLLEQQMLHHEEAETMRQALRGRSLQVPQFWMMDYLGLVEEFSRSIDVIRDDSAFGGQSGPAFASRYHGKSTDSEAVMVIKEVADLIKASKEASRLVAPAVFRAMQGIWTLNRKINSRNATSPGGTFSGTAHFHPRTPTSSNYSAEYLYIEEGTFKMDTGYSFPATRRYIYRYNEKSDKISAWFVDEDGESVGALFNTWDFYEPGDAYHGWMAKGHHWCDPDTYKNTCEFRFRGASLQTFGITYQVEGPKKDYNHESWYERP